jgi:hypothetical protein
MWRDKVDILKRDERFFILQKDDPALGAIRPLVIEDLYDDVAHLGLPASVPKEIAHQFDLARKAYLYAWFEYEMATLAEAHSYTVVEMAIKRRIKDDPSGEKPKQMGLQAAINHAREKGWLDIQDFEYLSFGERKSFLGKPHLSLDFSVMQMELCHKIIVALFP